MGGSGTFGRIPKVNITRRIYICTEMGSKGGDDLVLDFFEEGIVE